MLCGWLSPKADFYPCEAYGHIRLSEKIAASCYPALSCPGTRTDDFLLSRSWIKLYQDGLVSEHPLTDEQVDWLSREAGELSFKQERCFVMYLDWEAQKV